MPKRVPLCVKCGEIHHNFQSCDGAAAKRVKDTEETRLRTNRMTPVFRPRPPVHPRDDGFIVVHVGDQTRPMVIGRRWDK